MNRIKFIESIRRTEHITSFRFENCNKLTFKPGQFTKIIFDKNDIGNKDLNKYLSFSSSPGKEYLEFSKRISDSNFSRKLTALKKGDEIFLTDAMGNCLLKKEEKKVSFIIGGIGCTPAISILEDMYEKGNKTDIHCFYGNSAPNDIAYDKELKLWTKKLNLKITHVVIENPDKLPGFELGFINAPIIEKNMPDFSERLIYIFGPPIMVKILKDVCLSMGCSENRILAENFMGY